jgi:type IV fimbrial biogenesis protein FimT
MKIKNYSSSGFTIIELLTTLAVAGILLSVAIPSYRDLVRNNCLTTNTNLLVVSFQQARSEAIKRRTDVTVAAAGTWANGWTIKLKEDRDDDAVMDTGEDYNGDGDLDADALVRTVTLGCTTTITEIDAAAAINPGDSSAGDTSFVYGSDGFIDKAATFDFCDDRTAETGRQVRVSITGRPNTDSGFSCS